MAQNARWDFAILLVPPFVVALYRMFVFSPSCSTAADGPIEPPRFQRITVSEDLSDNSSVSGCLAAACEAANAEDLVRFMDCFTASMQRKLRKPAAMLFVEHDVSLDLLATQVIKQTDQHSQVVVKYRVQQSEDCYTIISTLELEKESGGWKISREKIHRSDHQQKPQAESGRAACFGGQKDRSANGTSASVGRAGRIMRSNRRS